MIRIKTTHGDIRLSGEQDNWELREWTSGKGQKVLAAGTEPAQGPIAFVQHLADYALRKRQDLLEGLAYLKLAPPRRPGFREGWRERVAAKLKRDWTDQRAHSIELADLTIDAAVAEAWPADKSAMLAWLEDTLPKDLT